MRLILQILSYVALALVIVPPALYLAGNMEKVPMSWWMLAGTVLWFATVPFWMGRDRPQS